MSFDYISNKIKSASFRDKPFRHLYIEDLLESAHFSELTSTAEIKLRASSSDSELFQRLFDFGWKMIDFPGCITNEQRYIRWHKSRSGRVYNNSACEGFGVTLRLELPKSTLLQELQAYLGSRAFHEALANKFDLALDDTYFDGGIQKYLDGYEISPHPDIRSKELTFMVNVNPGAESEKCDHHTHYLSFKPEYRYIQSYWQANTCYDRAWVPWTWCETVWEQRANNSMVIFAPGNDSMHGVRARYEHLSAQRTQLYGNLWAKNAPKLVTPQWEDFVIQPGRYSLTLNNTKFGKKLQRAFDYGEVLTARLLGRDTYSRAKVGRRAYQNVDRAR